MKNLTVSVKEEVLQRTRVAAAHAGKSMSQYVGEVLEERHREEQQTPEAIRRLRLERLRRVFDGPKLDISENGRMPNADERNAR